MQYVDGIRKREIGKDKFETCVKKEIAYLLEQGEQYIKHYLKGNTVFFVFNKTQETNRKRKDYWDLHSGLIKGLYVDPRAIIKHYKDIEEIIESYDSQF